ncbi:helix-turn-helix domain-containing protein [Agrobacterium rosae]|uniref:helix-turn-helix domain-containing protein n=1 Tax=Agrobacterium rosae TaxID=1972867 RepID=UPI003B9DE6CC
MTTLSTWQRIIRVISIYNAVAEASSFRFASERLGVIRSAVSQSIRRTENRVGCPCFSGPPVAPPHRGGSQTL